VKVQLTLRSSSLSYVRSSLSTRLSHPRFWLEGILFPPIQQLALSTVYHLLLPEGHPLVSKSPFGGLGVSRFISPAPKISSRQHNFRLRSFFAPLTNLYALPFSLRATLLLGFFWVLRHHGVNGSFPRVAPMEALGRKAPPFFPRPRRVFPDFFCSMFPC